jgi:DNA ligase (NAD+)
LANRTFVLSGALAAYTRDEARRLIEAQGGRVADAVTRRTDAVVLGERPGQKLADARRLGIQTIDEPAFRRLLERR